MASKANVETVSIATMDREPTRVRNPAGIREGVTLAVQVKNLNVGPDATEALQGEVTDFRDTGGIREARMKSGEETVIIDYTTGYVRLHGKGEIGRIGTVYLIEPADTEETYYDSNDDDTTTMNDDTTTMTTDEKEKITAAFENFASKGGYDPEEVFEVIREKYGEEDTEGDALEEAAASAWEVEDTEDEEDETPDGVGIDFEELDYNTELKPLVSEVCDDYPEDSSKAGLIEALQSVDTDKVAAALQGDASEDTEVEDTEDTDDFHLPYDNDLSDYDDPKPNMTLEAIKAHPGFEDVGKDAEALQHHQLKNGVCEDCGIAYKWQNGDGERCYKCVNGDGPKSDTSGKSNAKKAEEVAEKYDITTSDAQAVVFRTDDRGDFDDYLEAVREIAN